MKCKICDSNKVSVIYHGVLKTGLLKGWTEKQYDVFQCDCCKCIWNNGYKDYDFVDFYESAEYRNRIETDISIEAYCEKYDREVLEKLEITGTGIFRNRVVADVGCGGGSFIDYLSGVAKDTVAIEPSKIYRDGLKNKGHAVYAYAQQAQEDYGDSVDVVTSFDVIEHVENPKIFLEDIYNLLKEGGHTIIGTPTDYPVLREMLGDTFNSFIFQIQHPWIFSPEAMVIMAEHVGFKEIKIDYKQKYGIGNLLSWLLDATPRGDIKYDFIDASLDAAYKKSMAVKDKCEYIIMKAIK